MNTRIRRVLAFFRASIFAKVPLCFRLITHGTSFATSFLQSHSGRHKCPFFKKKVKKCLFLLKLFITLHNQTDNNYEAQSDESFDKPLFRADGGS